MAISLRQLRYFETAVHHGSITVAANNLHVSQSAVSVAIKDLEQSLGVELILRSQHGVKPTKIGQLIYTNAQQINRLVARLPKLANAPKNLVDGVINISISTAVLSMLAPLLLSEFQEQYPNIHINLTNMEWPDCEQPLLSGDIDFFINATTQAANDQFDVKPISIYQRYLWVNGSDPKSDLDSIHVSHLKGERVFVYEYDYILPEFRAYVDRLAAGGARIESLHSTEAIRRLVQANIGFGILSELSFVTEHMSSKNVYVKNIIPAPLPFVLGFYSVAGKIQRDCTELLYQFLMKRIETEKSPISTLWGSK